MAINPYQSLSPPTLPFLMAGFAPLAGLLPNPVTDVLYTVPAGGNTTVASIEIQNASGGVANVQILINLNGTDLPFIASTLQNKDRVVDGVYRNLPEGAVIKGISDVANVTYIVQVKENPV